MPCHPVKSQGCLAAAGLDPGETPHHVLLDVLVQEVLVYFTFLQLLHHGDRFRRDIFLVTMVPLALLPSG